MEAGELPLAGKPPASNSDDMTLISKTHKMGGENSHKLSLDIHTSSTVHTYISALALCRQAYACSQFLQCKICNYFMLASYILIKLYSACKLHFYDLKSKEKKQHCAGFTLKIILMAALFYFQLGH